MSKLYPENACFLYFQYKTLFLFIKNYVYEILEASKFVKDI
jgi:hypothetical protein